MKKIDLTLNLNGDELKKKLNLKNGKDGSPDSPEEVRDKLQTLKGSNRLDASAIKNLPQSIIEQRGGSSSGGCHTIQEEGVSLTQRSKLNFVGTYVTATDDSANDATKITIADQPQYTTAPVGANPSQTIDLSVHNGSATTFMRSDAAPALSQAIVPTWSGVHTFTPQDIHNGGISLGTSGVIVSAVADGASAIGYDFNDSITRTAGFTRQLRQGATIIESVSFDGRYSFGIGASPVLNNLLAFSVTDSSYPDASPIYEGILSSINHANTAATIPVFNGITGQAIISTATGLNAVVVTGVMGSVASLADSSMSGKVLACFSGYATRAGSGGSSGGATKDITLVKNAHIAGLYDHLTIYWAPNISSNSSTGYPTTNRPAIISSSRQTIQDWGASVTIGSPVGQYWAVYGENINGTLASYPAVTGYLRMTYPRRTAGTGVRAMHAWWEPWPNTSTIRGGSAVGDTYFDDGTNFSAGLYQSVVAGAYQKVVSTIVGRSTAQTAAVASVATFTVGAVDASFEVSMNVLVTTSTIHAFNLECAYTDEGNTARTLTLQISNLAGAFVTSVANAAGAVPYEGVPLHIRAKAATTITLRTQAAGTYTTVTYNVEGIIKQTS